MHRHKQTQTNTLRHTHTHTRSGLCKAQAGVSQTRSQRWQRSGNGSGRRQLGAARKCKLAEANWRRRTVASSQATRERVRSGTEHEKRATRYEKTARVAKQRCRAASINNRQSSIVSRRHQSTATSTYNPIKSTVMINKTLQCVYDLLPNSELGQQSEQKLAKFENKQLQIQIHISVSVLVLVCVCVRECVNVCAY